MSVQTILKVERLTKTYPTAAGALTVLHEVSFDLAAGSTCAIVGPSGSGKTTLLGLCAGLDQPSTGTVRLDGREIGGLPEDQRAPAPHACVCLLFQDFPLIPTPTAPDTRLVPTGPPARCGPTRAGPAPPPPFCPVARRPKT